MPMLPMPAESKDVYACLLYDGPVRTVMLLCTLLIAYQRLHCKVVHTPSASFLTRQGQSSKLRDITKNREKADDKHIVPAATTHSQSKTPTILGKNWI